MRPPKLRTLAGPLGHFRYERADAKRIREVSAKHLGESVLGPVTMAAREYLFEREAPSPLRPADVTRELRRLGALCDQLLETVAALSQESRDAMFHQHLSDKSPAHPTKEIRALAAAAELVGDLAARTAGNREAKKDNTRYSPRDADRRLMVALTRIWCQRSGPLKPFSRYLKSSPEQAHYAQEMFWAEPVFHGPLADFLRACMTPILGDRDLENLLEELRRAGGE